MSTIENAVTTVRQRPVITFHAADRTFYRVFKEDSLSQLKNAVRRKLNLSDSTPLRLAQISGSKTIELDDDDDFEAFSYMTQSMNSVDVSVMTDNGSDDQSRVLSGMLTPGKRLKKLRKQKAIALTRDSSAMKPVEHADPSVHPSTDTILSRKVNSEALRDIHLGHQRESNTGSHTPRKLTNAVASSGSLARHSGNGASRRPVGSPPSFPSTSGAMLENIGSELRPTPTDERQRKKRKRMSIAQDVLSPAPESPNDVLEATDHTLARPPKKKRRVESNVIDATGCPPAPPTKNHTDQVRSNIISDRTGSATNKQSKERKKKDKPHAESISIPGPLLSVQQASVDDGPGSSPNDPNVASQSKSRGKSKKRNAGAEAAAIVSAVVSKVPDNEDSSTRNPKKLRKSKLRVTEEHVVPQTSEPEQLSPPESPEPREASEGKPKKKSRRSNKAESESHRSPEPAIDVSPAREDIDSPREPVISTKSKRKSRPSKLTPEIVKTVMDDAIKIVDLMFSQGPRSAGTNVGSTKLTEVQRVIIAPAPGPLDETTKDVTTSIVEGVKHTSASAPRSSEAAGDIRQDGEPSITPHETIKPTESRQGTMSHPSTVPLPTPSSLSIRQPNDIPGDKHPLIPRSVVPAGSEVSEVAVEGQDEGSSNESSSSDEEVEEEFDAAMGMPIVTAHAEELANVSLEELLRGPVHEGSVLAQIPSSNASEDEGDQESDQDVEDEDERMDANYRRLSRKFSREDSSDEEQAGDVVAGDEEMTSPTYMDVDQSVIVDEPAGSQEVVPEAEMMAAGREENGDKTERHRDPCLSLETGASNVEEIVRGLNESNVISPNSPNERAVDGLNEALGMTSVILPQSSRNGCQPVINASDDNNASVLDKGTHAASILPGETETSFNNMELHEVAEEILESTSGGAIEPALGYQSDGAGEYTPGSPGMIPLRSQQTPGRIRRMKDRHGRLNHDPSNSPVLVTELSEATHQSTPLPARPATRASTRSETGVTTRSNTPPGRTQKHARIAVSMPPPSDPVGTEPAAKRRGGKLSDEEKARREEEKLKKKAEKEAEKLRKVREREAEKARKAQEKEAEKARKAQEKAAEKVRKAEVGLKQTGEKAQAHKEMEVSNPNGTQVLTTGPSPATSTSLSGDIEGVTKAASPRAQRSASPVQPSVSPVKWTTLSQEETSLIDPDSSMADELQPSSPGRDELAVPPAPKTTALADYDAPSTTDEAEVTVVLESNEDESQTGDALRSESPLFLPSNSQYPITPIADPEILNSIAQQDSSYAESEEEIQSTLTRPTKPRNWTASAPFRRLSDLASQQLFSPATFSNSTFFAGSRSVNGTLDIQTNGAGHSDTEEESDDDAGSDSDDDADKSHIPEHRKAGAGVSKRKKSGLLSFA